MKRRKLTRLIILISVSALGLVGIQSQVLSSYVKREREKLTSQIFYNVEKIIIKRVVEKSSMSTQSGHATFPENALQSLVSSSFHDSIINQPYGFGILNNETDKVLYTSNSSYLAPLLLSKYKIPFNLDFQIEDPSYTADYKYTLIVYLPEERAYLFKQISSYLITSILFIGMIFIAFFLSLRFILYQKKQAKIHSDFVDNMSHETKTPIATIAIASEALNDDSLSENKAVMKEYHAIIKNENERLKNMINAILEQSKIERTTKKDLHREEISLHEVIQNSARSSSILLKNKEGKIELALNADNCNLYANKVHITNLINNLIENAIKYTPESPLIQITTKNIEEGMEIRVKDNGIGISPKNLKKIFKKYYRVANSVSVKGFGLGLNYVQYVVKIHDGTIKVESELGKGSTFIVYLLVC